MVKILNQEGRFNVEEPKIEDPLLAAMLCAGCFIPRLAKLAIQSWHQMKL
jgi:hypothetical protein